MVACSLGDVEGLHVAEVENGMVACTLDDVVGSGK